MLSLNDVTKFMTQRGVTENLAPDEDPKDFAFAALMMANEYAAANQRDATLEDVELSFKVLCKIHWPGKLTQSEQARVAINRLVKLGRSKNTMPLIMLHEPPPTFSGEKDSLPLFIGVKIAQLELLKIDTNVLPQSTLDVDGKLTKITSLRAVVERSRGADLSKQTGVLRTFRLHEDTIKDLHSFLARHPEVGSLNHLVEIALKEFTELHKNDKSWLRAES